MSDKKTHWFFSSATSIFILFFVSIYLKTILFHLFIFGSDDLTQLIYFSKFVPALQRIRVGVSQPFSGMGFQIIDIQIPVRIHRSKVV